MRRRFPVHLAFFVATLGTAFHAGSRLAAPGAGWGSLLWTGGAFCVALVGTLLVHEAGHSLLARRHGVAASLPWFIPVPLGPVGTLGAFIELRSALPSRRAVLDIGAAGPIAGFLVAVPLLFWGFATSPEVLVPRVGPNAIWQSPASVLVALVQGREMNVIESAIALPGHSLVTWLASRATHGRLPPGVAVQLGPVGMAAWAALYVTALNLVPVGQLDGGHVLYGLLGDRAARVSKAFTWALFALGLLAFWGWLVWWAVARFAVGTGHPQPLDDGPPTARQRLPGLAALAVLAVTFVPVPFHF